MVDKMSKEIDKETKKRESAQREKNETSEKLHHYQSAFDELRIDDPVKFMKDFVALQSEHEDLKAQVSDQANQIL